MKAMKYVIVAVLAVMTALAVDAKVNVDVLAAPQFSTKFSFRAGVGVEIPLTPSLSLDPGLYFSMKHRQREEVVETTSQSGEVLDAKSCELNAVANYLQLPVYLSFNIPTRETDLQKIMFGPYFGYCLGGNSTVTQRHNGEETFVMTTPTYPVFLNSRFDFGLAVEYKYILKSHFVFGVYVEFGFKKIFDSLEVAESESLTFHMSPGAKNNQTIGLSLGYRF